MSQIIQGLWRDRVRPATYPVSEWWVAGAAHCSSSASRSCAEGSGGAPAVHAPKLHCPTSSNARERAQSGERRPGACVLTRHWARGECWEAEGFSGEASHQLRSGSSLYRKDWPQGAVRITRKQHLSDLAKLSQLQVQWVHSFMFVSIHLQFMEVFTLVVSCANDILHICYWFKYFRK